MIQLMDREQRAIKKLVMKVAVALVDRERSGC